MKKTKRLSVVSLFSGAMGLDYGLMQTSRFRVVACVEKEKAFCDTIRGNISRGHLTEEPLVYETDIMQLDPSAMMRDLKIKPGQLDLLVGGPPCQSFSTAGRRGTVADPRGTLLWEFLRFVKALRPKFFLMENVRGLLSAAIRHRPLAQRPARGGPPLASDESPGSVVRLFAKDCRNLGSGAYHMDCFEVNAVNYGAPQLRERALFIGNRYNAQVDFLPPSHGGSKDVPGKVSDTPDIEALQPWRTLGDVIGDLDEDAPVTMDFSPRKQRYLAMVPPGGNWRHLSVDVQKESMGKAFLAKGGRSGWWRRLSFDLPCPTLMTMPNHSSTALCHPAEVRALTVREYCRIQEFPDSWIVCGTPVQQYAQIGNAVPVRLGAVAGLVIADALNHLKKRRWAKYAPRPEGYRRVYLQSHVRTRQWYKDGSARLWRDGASNGAAAYAAPKTKRTTSALG